MAGSSRSSSWPARRSSAGETISRVVAWARAALARGQHVRRQPGRPVRAPGAKAGEAAQSMQGWQPAPKRLMLLPAGRSRKLRACGPYMLADHPRLQGPRHAAWQHTVAEQPRDRQPAVLQEPQRGHLTRLLGRTVAQIGLEDRLLTHGEDLVAVLLLKQPGTDHAAKHLTGDGLHVACREPLVAAHHRSERSTSCAHVRRVPSRFLVQHAIPSPAGLTPATATHGITPACGQPRGGVSYG